MEINGINPTIRTLVKLILMKCLDINNLRKGAVFFEYSGHTKGVTVYVYKNGWEANSYYDCVNTIYIDWEDAQTKLYQLIDFLCDLENTILDDLSKKEESDNGSEIVSN